MLLFVLNVAATSGISGSGTLADGAESVAGSASQSVAAAGALSDGAETVVASDTGTIGGSGTVSDGAEVATGAAGVSDQGAATASDGSETVAGEDEVPVLVLTGYAKPLPAHLIARYPAFTDVSPTTIQYWLTDAERSVDTSWLEGDYATALMALAAHNMALAGIGADPTTLTGVAPGVTRLQSGSMSVSLTTEAANALVTGGFAATRYGQEYQLLLAKSRGGPRVSDTGAFPVENFGYPYPYGYGGYY